MPKDAVIIGDETMKLSREKSAETETKEKSKHISMVTVSESTSLARDVRNLNLRLQTSHAVNTISYVTIFFRLHNFIPLSTLILRNCVNECSCGELVESSLPVGSMKIIYKIILAHSTLLELGNPID